MTYYHQNSNLTLPALDQIGSIPWWLWLVFLAIVLVILIAGFFVKDQASRHYPGVKQPLPEADDQTSTGTELESNSSG